MLYILLHMNVILFCTIIVQSISKLKKKVPTSLCMLKLNCLGKRVCKHFLYGYSMHNEAGQDLCGNHSETCHKFGVHCQKQTFKIWDQYQFLGNCAPTPPLIQQVIMS